MSIKIGDTPKRREDHRFLTGTAEFLDDREPSGTLHAVLLRSPHAHAVITAIDYISARAMPGVVAILTSAETQRDGLQDLRPTAEANVRTGEPFTFMTQPLLARGKVRYVGEPVALVIADTRTQALDAAEQVMVDYDPLPAVVTPDSARAPGAPLIADAVPGNVCMDWPTGDVTAVDAAIAHAAHVVTIPLDNHRIIIQPMEPRGIVATYESASGKYTARVSSQNMHAIRDFAARALAVDPGLVRFYSTDVGGNFGAKNFIYPEYVLMLWAAKVTGRPVKWLATRNEVCLADHQARDQLATATLALDTDGRILALKVDSVANAGAYLVSTCGVQAFQYPHLAGSIYRIPALAMRIAAVLTNTTPVGVTRGPGFAEAINIMERILDAAARQTGIDRVTLRRINMVPSDAVPFVNAVGEKVDSGTFPETFDLALREADVAGFADRRRASEANGKLRGLGFAYHIKGTGGAPHENADIKFEPDGRVLLTVGTHATGQAHETTFPQIVADLLGLPYEIIRHRQGDTDIIPIGGASGSSRSTYMAGTAIFRAAEEIVSKGRRIASDMLEASEADIAFDAGRFVVKGTDRSVALLDVAAKARASGDTLDTYHRWTREWQTVPNGTHVVEVEIDRDTGQPRVDRYTAVDDYGVLINPMIARGQAHGSIVQGIGQALFEQAAFDPESGQALTGSFMDYAMPRADDVPSFALSFNPSRCTTNPLGVKGSGEPGAIAAYPAIANAIHDALAPFGAPHIEGPATPERIWQAMQQRG